MREIARLSYWPMSSGQENVAEFGDPDGEPSWDASDPRRQHDQFAPPMEPCECYCLHCNRVFMSDQIWFQRVIGDKNGFEGFWMCPTPNCGGAGFTFDIFPTDPTHPANAGWSSFDDDEEGIDEEALVDEQGNIQPNPGTEEWDPDEPKYKALDEDLPPDDDIEGEEWKFGLEPGEQLPEQPWQQDARKEWEEEQARYDAPDERPRVLDWSNREDRDGPITEDDIPF